jgi:hypothetical protein
VKSYDIEVLISLSVIPLTIIMLPGMKLHGFNKDPTHESKTIFDLSASPFLEVDGYPNTLHNFKHNYYNVLQISNET